MLANDEKGNTDLYPHTLDLFRTMFGPRAAFRSGQWQAIETIAVKKQRALVVQRIPEHYSKLKDWLQTQSAVVIKPKPQH
jgi:tryptophan 2,3-dioxygenase